jgi:hypothetical protein
MEFRYQLTPIGGPASNLHVAQEIRGGKFKIAGGTSKLRVSWHIGGELKERRVSTTRTPEKPFDEKLAQRFRRDAQNFARLVEELKVRMQRLLKG